MRKAVWPCVLICVVVGIALHEGIPLLHCGVCNDHLRAPIAESSAVPFVEGIPVSDTADISDSGEENQPLHKWPPAWSILACIIGLSAAWWAIGWWNDVYSYPSGRRGYILAVSSLAGSWVLCFCGFVGILRWSAQF